MYVNERMGQRIALGQTPLQRPSFGKQHGAAQGVLHVRADLAAACQVGVFQARAEYPAWVRFSSDAIPGAPDLGTTLGMAIKLFNIPGRKLLHQEENAHTQDFVFQFNNTFFVDNAREMCDFTHNPEAYIARNPSTLHILDKMRRQVDSVLSTPYWSVLPYRLGEKYVKYKIVPGAYVKGLVPMHMSGYLKQDLQQHLLTQPFEFHFYAQLRDDPDKMPLDKATVAWRETEDNMCYLATLTLFQQDINAPGQGDYGQNLAFNPWHTLPEHEPVGSLNEMRRVVYQAAADLRRNYNGIPVGEPTMPKPSADAMRYSAPPV